MTLLVPSFVCAWPRTVYKQVLCGNCGSEFDKPIWVEPGWSRHNSIDSSVTRL